MPRILKNKRILSLDLTKVIAGTKFRGEFEERMKRIVTEATQDDSIILFIDEIHTIIGAGGSEGAMDASNILKPALARGDFQLIGATTSEEYTKYFEKDAALVRRFQPVRVKEPTVEETITILKGIKHRFEDYHRILVSEDVAEAIASLSDRYISDRFLPDKAIDLLDEACARKRMEQVGSYAGFKKERKEIREIIEKIEAALSDGDITEARELKKEKNKLEKSLERKTGARGLRAIMEGSLMDLMYKIPSDDTIRKCTITKDVVDGTGEPEIVRGEASAQAKTAGSRRTSRTHKKDKPETA